MSDTSTSTQPHSGGRESYRKAGLSRKLLTSLAIFAILLLIIDLLYWVTGYDKHPYFKWETWPGFYGIFGFVASVVIVLAARYLLRPLLKRPIDYYQSETNEGGDLDA